MLNTVEFVKASALADIKSETIDAATESAVSAVADQANEITTEAVAIATASAAASQIASAASEANALLYRNQAQAASAIATGQVLPLVATRAVADCLISDGATAGRCAFWPLGSVGAVAGKVICIPFEIDVPTTNPMANVTLGAICPQITASPYDQNNACSVVHGTSGNLAIRQSGANYLTDRREFSYAGFRAAYSGAKGLRGVVAFTVGDSTIAPVIYIQGVDVSANFALTTAGTPPNWLPLTLVATYYVVGYNFPAGRFTPHPLTLGVLSLTGVVEWTQTGRLPSWCEIAVGNSIAKYTSDFSTGTDNWSSDGAFGGTATGNVDTSSDGAGIPPSDNWLRLIHPTASGQIYSYRSTSVPGIPTGAGMWCKADLYIPAGVSFSYVRVGRINGAIATGTAVVVPILKGALNPIFATFVADVPTLQIVACNASGTVVSAAAGDAIYIKNVIAGAAGPLFRQVIQPGQVLDDAGVNGIAGILTPGIIPVTRQRDVHIRGSLVFTSSGNLQLLAATLIDTMMKWRIRSITVTSTAAISVSIGNASAGAQYVSAQSVVIGDTDIATFASRLISGANLWVNANGAATLTFFISLERID